MHNRNLHRNTVYTLLLFLVASQTALAQNWGRFRGPNGSGTAENQNIPTKLDESTLLWKVAIPGLGNSSPVIWDNRLFLQSASKNGDERMLLCLNAKTGKEIWTKSFPGVKAHTHNKNTLASSTPAVDGKRVVTIFWDGEAIVMAAYDLKGKQLWQLPLGGFESQHGFGASPILYNDKVYFYNDQLNKAVFLCIDANKGKVVWEKKREPFRPCYSAPLLVEQPGKRPQFIVTNTMAVTSYDAKTGEVNWKWDWKWKDQKPLRTTASSLYTDGLVLAYGGDGGGDRAMVAIDINGNGGKVNPRLAWNNPREFPYVPTPLIQGKYVYVISDKGYAGCFIAKTGEKVWYKRIPDAYFTSSPVLVDGKIYAPSEQGDVYVFAAEPKYKLLARNSIGELMRASPAVANQRLYIRGRSHLFCFGRKK